MANSTTTTILSADDDLLGMSSDGRYIAYSEMSGNLDTLYMFDTTTDQSVAIDSFTANAVTIPGQIGGDTETPGFTNVSFSASGDYLFYSEGFTGAGPETYGDLFIKDLTSPTAPIDVTPTLPPDTSGGPFAVVWSSLTALAISDDGNIVVYDEDYNDIGEQHPDFFGIVVDNRTTGIVEELNSGDAFVSTDSYNDVTLSGDGRYLSFVFQGANQFIQDLQTGTQVVVPVGGGGEVITGGGGNDGQSFVSADQRYIAYDGTTNNGGSQNITEVFLHDNDAPAGTPDQVISTSADGAIANATAFQIAFSGNGEFDIFWTNATNLVPGSPANSTNVYIKDIKTGGIRQLDSVVFNDRIFISYDGSQIISEGSNGIDVTTITGSTLTVDKVNGNDYANGSTITVSGTSSAIGKTVIVSLPEGLLGTNSAIVQPDGTWSTTLSDSKLGDGATTIHAVVTDDFDNTTTVDHQFDIDRTPPQLDVTSVAGDNYINAAELAHAVVAGTDFIGDPAVGDSLVGELQIKIDNGPSTDVSTQFSPTTDPQPFSVAMDATGFADGAHTVTVTATDEAGNTTTKTIDVIIDTIPPKITITSVSGDDVVDSSEIKMPQGVHGTSDAIGQTVDVLLDGTVINQAVVQADGTWSSTVNFSGTVTGNHDVTAQVADEAGNIGRADAGVYVDSGFAVTQLSDGPQGEQGGGQGVLFPSLSADGTKLVFTGLNFDLIAPANGSSGTQVYIKDLTTGAITSATPDPSENSEFGAISQDGTKIVFVSNAALDPTSQAMVGDGPGYYTYEENLSDGIPHFRAFDSQTPDNLDPSSLIPASDHLAQPLPVFPLAIANNGYDSEMVETTNIDQSGTVDLFENFVLDGSVDANGQPTVPYNQLKTFVPAVSSFPGTFQAYAPEFSADGSVVAFEGRFDAEQPVGTQPGPNTQIYAGSTASNHIALASSSSDGAPMQFGAIDPALSADGNFLAFWSWGTDGAPEVYVKNLATGELTIASSDASGNPGVDNASGTFNAGFNSIAISADGRYVAFTSDANLTPDDSGSGADLYVKDMQTGSIERVPLPAGTFANDLSTQLAMRADGQYIAFTTSTGLSAFDVNHTTDIYGVSRASIGTPPTISIDPVAGDDRINASEDSKNLLVSGTSDAIGGNVALVIDGSTISNVVVGADGTWSTTIDATQLIDGAHQFRATVTNAAGATGSDGDLVTVDTVAPTVVLSADNTHIGDGHTATITATFSEGIGNLQPGFLVASGGTLSDEKFVDDHTYTATFTPDGLGNFTITANPDTAFDFSGNANTTGSSVTVADGVLPQIEINGFGPTTVLGEAAISQPIKVTGVSDAVGGTVTLEIDGQEEPAAVVGADDSWSTTADLTQLTNGVHQLQVSVTNLDGFTNGFELPFTVDTTPPTVVLSSDTTHFAVGQPVTVTATFSEAVHLGGSQYFEVGTDVTVTNEEFINDHSYAATFTPDSGLAFLAGFEVVINPGQVTDAAGNDNADFVELTIGRSFDGYIVGGTVSYANGSGNGATAITDSHGEFTLSGGNGPLIMTGGTDSSTGLAFTGTFETPDGGSVLSPLTTLIEKVIEANPGDSVAQATASVDSVLGLPAGTDLTSLDAVAGALAGDAASTAAFKAGSELLDVITLIQAAGGSPDAAYAALAADVANGPLDLTDVATIENIGQSAGLDSAAAQAVASIASATDAALANQLAGATTPLQVFIDITGTSIAEQGDASKALSQASGDAGYQQVADSYAQGLAATLSHDDLIAADNVACYCRGTLIETGRGETPVERLAIGDRVVTASGKLRPIKWIGTRSYGGRFILGRTDILPICIKAGSLGDDVPKRDLWISPHHAMYLDGVLIEARDLVNGVSIMQAERVEKVEYFHIELDSHDVILAEGALSETFVDDDSRGMFHNAHEYGALYPDAGRVAARYCAKRCAEGYEVEAARRRLSLRTGLQADEPRVTALRGYVDDVGAKRIAGWAQNADHPEAPVCLDIYVSGRLIGQTLANRYRSDLKRAGLGSGRHSFEFTPPAELAFAPEAVVVRRSLDGAMLECAALTRLQEVA